MAASQHDSGGGGRADFGFGAAVEWRPRAMNTAVVGRCCSAMVAASSPRREEDGEKKKGGGGGSIQGKRKRDGRRLATLVMRRMVVATEAARLEQQRQSRDRSDKTVAVMRATDMDGAKGAVVVANLGRDSDTGREESGGGCGKPKSTKRSGKEKRRRSALDLGKGESGEAVYDGDGGIVLVAAAR